jgi:hypothetical protein
LIALKSAASVKMSGPAVLKSGSASAAARCFSITSGAGHG